MARYGSVSSGRLDGVHPLLVETSAIVVRDIIDNSVIYGPRTLTEQKILFDGGFSKTMNSMHLPRDTETGELLSLEGGGVSWAVDLAPYPINWNDLNRFIYLGGAMIATAKRVFPDDWWLRWGGDWDGDTHFDDQKFMDYAHFEVRRGEWPAI